MPQSLKNTVSNLLESQYNIYNPDLSLMRAYTNDVYLVKAPNSRLILKIYGLNWRTDSDIRYEIDLLDHLDSKGVHVARSIKDKNGSSLQHIEIDGNSRQLVAFEFAAGKKPIMPATADMYFNEGIAAAKLHAAADDFHSLHHRKSMDLDYLINSPLSLVRSLANPSETTLYIEDFSLRIKEILKDYIAKDLDWGVCHGDLTYDNFHLTEEGQTIWYDFDSGGPGWRCIDIQGWAAKSPEFLEKWAAFLKGYKEVRHLSENDVQAAPYMYVAQEIWGIEVELKNRILRLGDDAVNEYLKKTVSSFKEWDQFLMAPKSS